MCHVSALEMLGLTGRCLSAARCESEGCQPEEPCWVNPALKPGCLLFSPEDLLRHGHNIKEQNRHVLHVYYEQSKHLSYVKLFKKLKQTLIQKLCPTKKYSLTTTVYYDPKAKEASKYHCKILDFLYVTVVASSEPQLCLWLHETN